MASKVNVKFVAILAGVLVIVAGGGAALAVFALKKGPQQNAALAEELAAKGDYEGAQRAMSRAVNRDPNNPAYLRRWQEMLGKTIPSTQQAYRERLDMFLQVRRRISDLDAGSIATQREYLDGRLAELRRFASDAAAWGAFITETDKIIAKFPEGSKDRAILRRYRGIGRLAQMAINFEMSDAERQAAREDLLAAVEADPADSMATAGLGDWARFQARQAFQIKDLARVDELLNEGKTLQEKFIAAHPPGFYPLITLAEIELFQSVVHPSGQNTTLGQVLTALQPRAQQILDALQTEDLKVIDDGAVSRAVRFAMQTGIKDAPDQGLRALDRLLAAHPKHPWYLFARASLSLQAGRPDECIERMAEIVALPDMPVSTEGWMLFRVRDEAALQQVSAAMVKWENARAKLDTAPADEREELGKQMAAALKQADELYEKVKTRSGVNDQHRMFIEGVLAYARNDLVGARRRLHDYVQATQRSDVRSMLLLGDVMRRQRTLGEAKALFERVLELDRNNVSAMLALAPIEVELKNYRPALELYDRLLQFMPGNEQLVRSRQILASIIDGSSSRDPIIKALSIAQELIQRTPPDTAGAIKVIKEAEPEAKDSRQAALLVSGLSMMAEREEALRMAERALQRFPDDATLVGLQKQLNDPDPLGTAGKLIDNDPRLNAEQKLLQKYLIHRNAGRTDRAAQFLEDLAKLAPDNAIVIGAQFDAAIAKPDLAEAGRLVEAAKKANVDKLGGRIFEMQYLAAQRKWKEAIATAQQATEIDALNPAAWRMLGQLQFANGDPTQAMKALERALQINPTDATAVNLYAQCLVSLNRAREALDFCRQKAEMGTSDAAFVNTWLTLEYNTGDKDKAYERRQKIFAANPSNIQNAIELGRISVLTRKTAQAEAVVTRLKAMQLSQNEAVPVAVLEAGVKSLQNKPDEAMAAFEALARSVPEEDRAGRVHVGFANLMMDLQNITLAEAVLKKGQEVEPKDSLPVTRTYADILFAQARFNEAIPLYEKIYQQSTDEADRARLARRFAETYLRAGKPAEARALIAKLMEEVTKRQAKPDLALLLLSAEVEHNLSATSTSREEATAARERAGKLLDQAIAADPQSLIAYFKRAQFRALDPGTFDGALADFEYVLKLDPKFTMARIPLASALMHRHGIARAAPVLREGLAADPKNVDLRVTLVRMLVAVGDLGPALVELAEGEKVAPDELSWPFIMGEIFMMQGNFSGAAGKFKTVWDRNKTAPNTLAYVESLLRKTPADTETSRKVLAEPSINTDTTPTLLIMRAMVNRLDKRPEDMKNDLRTALRTVDSSKPAVANDLVTLCMQKLFPSADEMVAVFKEITQPQGLTDAMRLAMYTRAIGSTTPTVTANAVEELTRLANSTDPIIKAAASRSLGDAAYRAKKYQDAERFWRAVLAIDPNNADTLNNLAYVLATHLGKAAEAEPLALKAVQLAPDKATFLDTLGQVYIALAQWSKADQALQHGLAITSNPVERAPLMIHRVMALLGKKDRPAADGLYRDLQNLMQQLPEIKTRYPDELEDLKRRMQSEN